MREILFRGKTPITNKWAFGTGLLYDGINTWIVDNPTLEPLAFGTRKATVMPETVGQYTGLTDKNGKKIFEGDIFKFNDEVFESHYTSCGTEYNSWYVENYAVVGFCGYSGRFDFVEYKFNENAVEADLHENNAVDFASFVSDLEVIGNIHDNPELLKGGVQ